MPNLIPCIECGRNISPSANKCPHCGNTDPLGVQCFDCGQRLKRAASTLFGSSSEHVNFHHECLAGFASNYFSPSEQLKCKDCHAILTFLPPVGDIRWATQSIKMPCPKCGCRIPIGQRRSYNGLPPTCRYCFEEIYSFQPIRHDTSDPDSPDRYHVLCYKIKMGKKSVFGVAGLPTWQKWLILFVAIQVFLALLGLLAR